MRFSGIIRPTIVDPDSQNRALPDDIQRGRVGRVLRNETMSTTRIEGGKVLRQLGKPKGKERAQASWRATPVLAFKKISQSGVGF